MPEKIDLREEIMNKYQPRFDKFALQCYDRDDVKAMLDEYFQLRSVELLEWMGKRNIECFSNPDGEGVVFLDKKSGFGYLTKEELFNNFL